MKLVINMMMGAIMAVNAEGITLAQGLGLRVEDLMEVVNQSAMGTPMFKLKVLFGDVSETPLMHLFSSPVTLQCLPCA